MAKHGSHHRQGATPPHVVQQSLNEQAALKAKLTQEGNRVHEHMDLMPQRKKKDVINRR
jgi:hypothetical protein